MAFRNLIIFSAGPPFRDLHTFLRTELHFLSHEFEHIYLLVNSENAPGIDLPENIHLAGLSAELSQAEKWLGTSKILSSELWHELNNYWKQPDKKIQAFKDIFNQYNAAEKFAERLSQFLEKEKINLNDNSTLFYAYWTDYRSIGLSLLKKEHLQLNFIARRHGWTFIGKGIGKTIFRSGI